MGSSKDRLKTRPLPWPLDKWVTFLTQHPTFPFWTKQENNVDIDIGCVVLESTVLNITVKPLMDQEKTAQLCY